MAIDSHRGRSAEVRWSSSRLLDTRTAAKVSAYSCTVIALSSICHLSQSLTHGKSWLSSRLDDLCLWVDEGRPSICLRLPAGGGGGGERPTTCIRRDSRRRHLTAIPRILRTDTSHGYHIIYMYLHSKVHTYKICTKVTFTSGPPRRSPVPATSQSRSEEGRLVATGAGVHFDSTLRKILCRYWKRDPWDMRWLRMTSIDYEIKVVVCKHERLASAHHPCRPLYSVLKYWISASIDREKVNTTAVLPSNRRELLQGCSAPEDLLPHTFLAIVHLKRDIWYLSLINKYQQEGNIAWKLTERRWTYVERALWKDANLTRTRVQ